MTPDAPPRKPGEPIDVYYTCGCEYHGHLASASCPIHAHGVEVVKPADAPPTPAELETWAAEVEADICRELECRSAKCVQARRLLSVIGALQQAREDVKWHADCRPNRQQSIQRLENAQKTIDQLADRVLEEQRAREAAEALVVTLRDENMCDICIGQPLASGAMCACGGTGFMSRTAAHMRERFVKAESQLATLTRERDEARDRLTNVRTLTEDQQKTGRAPSGHGVSG
jgi:hypothetical protein